MNVSKLFLLGILFVSCKSAIPFEAKEYYKGTSVSRYYNGSTIFELHSDETYRYLVKMEGGYVYKFSKGTWKQEGNKLFLFNKVSNPKELPVDFRICPSEGPSTELVVNVLPKKDPQFAHMPGVAELLKVDLIVDNVTYSLKNEATVISLQKPVGSIFFKAYPKPNVENQSEILNDTLRSQSISLKDMQSKVLMVDIDCNPIFFAQVRMPDDTLRIVNDHKIKWGKIYFKRPQ